MILRDFGVSLTKADHTYRADRLLYAGYLRPAPALRRLLAPTSSRSPRLASRRLASR